MVKFTYNLAKLFWSKSTEKRLCKYNTV